MWTRDYWRWSFSACGEPGPTQVALRHLLSGSYAKHHDPSPVTILFKNWDYCRTFKDPLKKSFAPLAVLPSTCVERNIRTPLFLSRFAVIIIRTVSLSMWKHSAIILIIKLSSCINVARTASTFSVVWLVRSLPSLGSLSTFTQPSLNWQNHSKTIVHDRHSQLYAFCNNLNISVAVWPLSKQNLTRTCCSSFRSMTIEKNNLHKTCCNYATHNRTHMKLGYVRSKDSILHTPTGCHVDSATYTLYRRSVRELFSHTL